MDSRSCSCLGNKRLANGDRSLEAMDGDVDRGWAYGEMGRGLGGRMDNTGGSDRGRRILANPSRVILNLSDPSIFSTCLIRAATCQQVILPEMSLLNV